MTEQQFLDLLDDHDAHRNIQPYYEQLMSSQVLRSMDVELVDAFLSHFELSEDMTFEEFMGLYKIFEAVYEKDKFPIIY
ncbi:hypothetical protein AB3Z07_19680 [Metabacillus halosaccharovorans]|uniref:hypothetical protein n=1 Tax=Metabacillus halosaccharovorans TaxID=930124 RepID=UPI000994B7B4|nr:hypothetical protein [Metabacillus halosaccharovorans]MCM3442735.1 hypothetical protein [Metabacillus halosaccharovorans]